MEGFLRILVVGHLWLTQPNKCGCSPAESGFLTWVKKTKSVSLQDRERSLWNTKYHCSGSYLLVVLMNTAIKIFGMKVVLCCIVGDGRKMKSGARGFPVMPSYETGPATHSSLLKPGKLGKGYLLLTFVLIAYIFTRRAMESRQMFLISFPSLGGFGELSHCQLRCTAFLSHMSLSHFSF